MPLRMQTFDSNGPDVRIRGSAFQVHEKYLQLARDASSSGDRIIAENYLQHAEHYYRIIAAAQEQQQQNGGEPQRRYRPEGFNGQDYRGPGDDMNGEGDEFPGEDGGDGQMRGDGFYRQPQESRPNQDGRHPPEGRPQFDNRSRQDGGGYARQGDSQYRGQADGNYPQQPDNQPRGDRDGAYRQPERGNNRQDTRPDGRQDTRQEGREDNRDERANGRDDRMNGDESPRQRQRPRQFVERNDQTPRDRPAVASDSVAPQLSPLIAVAEPPPAPEVESPELPLAAAPARRGRPRRIRPPEAITDAVPEPAEG
jgi:hypothetical protein